MHQGPREQFAGKLRDDPEYFAFVSEKLRDDPQFLAHLEECLSRL